MTMNFTFCKQPKIVLLYISLSIFFHGCSKDVKLEENINVPPKIKQPLDTTIISRYPRLIDLTNIAFALEKYKGDHRSYPLSSGNGDHWTDKNWDSILKNSSEINTEWIAGLVPKYIAELPIDPRQDGIPEHQYIYKSNGANYKLIALNPEDCKQIRELVPIFFDERFEGCNYGIWTPNAEKWN